MRGRAAIAATAAFAAVVFGVLWYRGGAVLAAVGSLVTIAVCLVAIVRWVSKKVPKRVPPRHAAAMVGVGLVMVLAALFLPVSAFDRGLSRNSSTSTTAAPSTKATPEAPTTTRDPTLDRYCHLAVEFLAHAQRFSGKGWQGNITKRDFDPIVLTAHAALDTAPQEMRAPMTVLASSYEAAQDGWTDDDMLQNTGLVFGTILSPAARSAADAVDVYENEHCF